MSKIQKVKISFITALAIAIVSEGFSGNMENTKSLCMFFPSSAVEINETKVISGKTGSLTVYEDNSKVTIAFKLSEIFCRIFK